MKRFSGVKRIYDDDDMEKLKVLCEKLLKKSKKIGVSTNFCRTIHKVNRSSISNNRVSNPVYSKYKNIRNRKEPPTFIVYQIFFIKKFKFLPMLPHHLSHQCGRKYCIIDGHINIETSPVNNARKRCHKILKKRAKCMRLSGKRGSLCLSLDDCDHEPECFWNC
jgi:hypothetical protein